MKTYLVRMTPLEPFTFSGEKGFAFNAAGSNGRSVGNTSYYQTSRDMPEQTTVIGMLRYIILKNKGVLKDFGEYTEDERKSMKDLIGQDSFSFERETFDMGGIKSVSPIFITDGEKEPDQISYFIRNPLCLLKDKNGNLELMQMEEKDSVTSNGVIQLPKKEYYNTKTELLYGFLSIGSKKNKKLEYFESLFDTKQITGNRKNGEEQEEGFFKREVKMFKPIHQSNGIADKLSFAVFVECEEGLLPKKIVAKMGLKKSAFLVETLPVENNDLKERIQQALGNGNTWYYALSDLMPAEKEKTFAIISKKQVRNLKTNMDKDSFQKAVTRSGHQYNLIAAGSVFYKEKPILQDNENLENAGYNCLIKIGGNT